MKTLGAAGAALPLVLALLLDTVPRFSLGDSASYLSSDLGGYLPDDRSWAYGLFASGAIRLSRNLETVAICQITVAWGGAILLARILAKHFQLGAWFFGLVVLALFCNPLSFHWARAFMTDTLAAACFAALVALLFGSAGTLVTAAGVFMLTLIIAALRSVYLPPLLLAFATVAALCTVRLLRAPGPDAAAERQAMLRYGVLTAAVLVAGASYGVINSRVLQKPGISTNHATTRFLVSAWSPLMAPAFAALDVPQAVKDQALELTYANRLASAFADNGISELLSGHYGGYQAAQAAYVRLLKGAVLDDPAAFLRLIARSWSDYVSPEKVLLYHRERRLTGTTNYYAPDRLPDYLVAKLRAGASGKASPRTYRRRRLSGSAISRMSAATGRCCSLSTPPWRCLFASASLEAAAATKC